MSQNRVEVLLVAKDNITATIRSMRGNIASGIGDAVGTMATLGAAIAASAIAFGSLGAGFNKAADLQTSQITNAYTLATVIGSTVSNAKTTIKDLNVEMAKLGDTLPGVTEDYQRFSTSLSATVAISAKGDMEKYKKTLVEASKYGGLLTSTSGADGAQGASALNRYLGGTMSQGEAHKSDIFQKNPNYKIFEAVAMKKMGLMGKDFEKQLTTAQRIAVFNMASSMMFTPEMIAAFGNTADTQFQALKSKMFNPVTGVFGFAREMKGLDGRTALDAITTMMGQLDIMSTQAGKWLSAHGINLDPMEAIGHMMDNLSGWASAFTAAMKGDKSGINTMVADIQKGFKSIKIEKVVGILNLMMSGLSGAIAAVDWANFGTELANGVAKALETFDWKKGADLLDQAYFAAINALSNFIRTSFNNMGKLSTPEQNAVMAKDDAAKKANRGAWLKDFKASPVGTGNKGAMDDFDKSPMGGLWRGAVQDFKKSPIGGMLNGNDPGVPHSSLPQLGQMSNNGSVFSPVINITGGLADGAQQTADYVLEAINNRYLQYRQEALV